MADGLRGGNMNEDGRKVVRWTWSVLATRVRANVVDCQGAPARDVPSVRRVWPVGEPVGWPMCVREADRRRHPTDAFRDALGQYSTGEYVDLMGRRNKGVSMTDRPARRRCAAVSTVRPRPPATGQVLGGKMIDELSAELGLFGREDDLRVMGDVVIGGGSAVAIGDPGVGKSSLLKVADHLAQRRGHRVLSVTPTQFDRGLPFAGLVELIAQCPDGADAGLPGPQQRALAVALHREEPTGDVDALAVPIAVRGLLTHLCSSEPVALIIDDLQWLDQASVGSLGFALRRVSIERHRLSVLVATRPEGSDSDLVRCLPEPRYEYSLQPLDDVAIGQLLRNRLGPRWTPPMSAGVARASAGNPFLALMIAKAMQADLPTGHGPSHQHHEPVFPVPPTLADLLRERVMQLPPESRDALLLVSAAGQLTLGQLQGIVDDTRLQTGS